ncbi:hypothetical protein [Streptomyces sp. NPDC054794]
MTAPRALRGLLLLGRDPVYAVHLPMFGPPYDFQAILRVTLSTPAYDSARSRFGTSAVFTARPETEVLLKDLEPGAEFPGELYFGRFDRDGDSLGPLSVRVSHLLHARPLDAPDTDPPDSGLTGADPTDPAYVVFGDEDRLFLTRRLTVPPDFDQTLTALAVDGEVREGWTVILPGRRDDLMSRPRPGEQITTADGTQLQILAEVYLETDDLAR